jgi:thiamine pyrophosphate-dependent acetolactate synthase large subunit-like protein
VAGRSCARAAGNPEVRGASTVKVIDAIARILKIEGAEFLSAYPTTPLIEAAAKAEIRPVLCRQERVGVGIADGYARVKNGKTLAAFCMQYMGDAAFGMTGLDFETAVRCGIPILTVVLNNSSMAIEIPHLVVSHDKYGTRDIGGRYADLGRAMGGWSERVERPEDIAGAFARARKATEGGQAALLEFITGQETRFSNRGVLR